MEMLILVIAILGIILAATEIYNHYKDEKQKHRRSYELYEVCFVADGSIYTQVIGGKSEEDVKQLIYSTYNSASELVVLSISSVQQSKNTDE